MTKLRLRPSAASTPPVADRTVAAARRRFERRQRARRWLMWRRLLVALAVLVLVAVGIWLVFFSSVLAVRGSVVSGTQVLTAGEVRGVADVPEEVPLATVDLDAVAARVETLVAVESVEVSRSWPDHVRIEVTERTAVAAVQREGQWRGLDASGVLFRTYPQRPEGLPEVRMRAQTSVEALAEAAEVVSVLPVTVRNRIVYLDVQTIDAISFRLSGGALVNWGSADDAGEKAAVLEVLLRQKASVYDVTAPGRPTIRP